jgi:hypothetical protein
MNGELSQAIDRLARTMEALSDKDLDQEWAWRYHAEGVRFALLGTYHELRDLAVTLAAGRAAAGIAITTAQHALAQYHAAYRDLTAVLLGIRDEELDVPPAEGEWSLRQVLEHIVNGDRVFYTLVHYAIAHFRAGDGPSQVTEEDMVALLGPDEPFERLMDTAGLGDILNSYADLHRRILRELAGTSEAEMQAPSPYWEEDLLTVRYRLHRFDAHVRQHTVQAIKTMDAIGRTPNEAKRLLRLVYNALAEVEGALIGAWDFGLPQQQELAEIVVERTADITTVVAETL